MKPIIFIGTGAVASEVISYLEDMQLQNSSFSYEIYGFLDDSTDNFHRNCASYGYEGEFLGAVSEHNFSDQFSYIFGFSSPQSKNKVVDRLNIEALDFPNIIHPSAIVSKSAKLGKGNVVNPNCVIGPNAKIGDFNLVTSYSFISHDCVVGNYNFLSTAGLAGNVNVGDRNFFGIRSTVIPSVSVGSDNTIQAGMVIDKNVTDNETVFYRFKEKITIINPK